MKDELTRRELRVAELIAWGANRKEVPDMLQQRYGGKLITINTVNNIVANIYAKLSLNSETQLSAWYFTNYLGVDSSLSPLRDLKRTLYSIVFLLILLPQIFDIDQAVRPQRTRVPERTERAEKTGRSRRGREDEILFD